MLLEGYKNNKFLHWIVDDDEKKIYYNNHNLKIMIYEIWPNSQINAVAE